MPINVSEALDSDTAEVITVERVTGNYVDGLYVKGVPTTFKTLASMQQPTPSQMQSLEEGQRDRNIFSFISKKPIFTVKDREGLPADVLIHKGVRYEAIDSGDWSSYGHTSGMAAKV